MPSDESKGSQLDAIGSLAQRQLDNTVAGLLDVYPQETGLDLLDPALQAVAVQEGGIDSFACAFYLFIRAPRT